MEEAMTSNALEETKIAALALTLEERAELLDFLENITLEKCVDIRSEWMPLPGSDWRNMKLVIVRPFRSTRSSND